MDVEKILRWMYRIFKFLCKLGFFWAMLGGFFYWISATNGHNLGALYEFFWLWVVAVGGTFLHFYNRIMSRIKHRKVNLVLDVLKAVFGGKMKLPEGVKAKLDTYKEPFGVIYGREKDKYYLQDEDAPNSVAVFGTPGSGKSQGIFIPTLLSYGSQSLSKPLDEQPSVFVVDVKGELLQSSYKYRSGTMKRQIKYLSFGSRLFRTCRPADMTLSALWNLSRMTFRV